MIYPKWVHIEDSARVRDGVEFIPYKDKKTIIRRGALIDTGAKIHGGVDIGEDCIVGHYTIIRFNTKIGTHSLIGNLSMLEGNIEIGHHSLVHSQCHLAQYTKIGNYVFMAPLSGTTNDVQMHHFRGVYSRKTLAHWEAYSKPAVIEDAVQIGVGVTILAGVTIGTHATIGLGSNVIRDIPPYAVAVGNPARVIRILEPDEDVIVICPDHPELKVTE